MAWQDGLTLGGAPVAHLHVSTTAPVATVAVKLSDVDPTSGVSCLITKGSLNLTHRESHVTPSAVVPGEVYEVRISLLECAYTLLPGHRLRLSVAGGDLLNLWPAPCVSTPLLLACDSRFRLNRPACQTCRGAQHPSVVRAPVHADAAGPSSAG